MRAFLYIATFLELFLEAWFFARFTVGRNDPLSWAPFLAAGCALGHLTWITLPLRLVFLPALLFLWGVLFLKTGSKRALSAALLTAGMTQAAFGITGAVLSLLAPSLFPLSPARMGCVLMTGGEFLALALEWLFLWLAFRHSLPETPPPLPGPAAFFVLSLYTTGTLYGGPVSLGHGVPRLFWTHSQILLLQILSAAGLLALLSLRRALTLQVRQLQSAVLDAQLQRRCAQEAQRRLRQTQALRHDWNNHLAVIQGLLRRENVRQAADYASELRWETASSFFTGSPVLDVLLSEKKAQAGALGIHFSCSGSLPPDCPLPGPDLCAIAANGLDNALRACAAMPPEAERFIRFHVRRQFGFLYLEIENSRSGSGPIRPGTGLSSIRQTAEAWSGTVETLPGENRFLLKVLLNLSQPPKNR